MRGATLVLVRLALLVAVLVLWEVLPRAGIVNPMLLPPLSDVLRALGQILVRGDVHEAMAVTAAEVVVAFMIAVPLGAVLGVLSAENAYFGDIFKPMLFYVFSIPKSIFLPMFILIGYLAFHAGLTQGAFYAARCWFAATSTDLGQGLSRQSQRLRCGERPVDRQETPV